MRLRPVHVLRMQRLTEQRTLVAWTQDCNVHGIAGEDYIVGLAEDQHQKDIERAGLRVLRDFRNGALGSVALEVPSSVQI